MADGRVEANADVNQEILKAAQQEISSVLTNAMGNMTPVSNDSGKPESAKQHSTAEEQVPGSEYVQPMQDPYNKAIKYLENHNILQLFQQLTASIVYTKPEKPLEFMMTEVERMKKDRDAEKH